MALLNVTELPALVDELTSIQTQIAVLTARADQIKADLTSTGMTEVCGSTTRAVISYIAPSSTVSWKDLAMSFNPSNDEISAFSKNKDGYTRVEIKGYNVRRAA